MKKSVLSFLILLCPLAFTSAQGSLNVPGTSQKAEVTQRIGITDITVKYSSPLVKGRVIWGELVPFGEVWRAGANENTVISFSTPVTIEGKNLPAGKYGLHMIPSKGNWTIIFSSDYQSWGSYFYNQKEDVLRVDVTPESSPMQEWLSFRFTDIKSSSVKLMLNWEKVGVGFLVQVDVPQTVLASMRQELRGSKYYSWENPYQAADYCAKNKMNLDEAMMWIDHSIEIKETFANLNVKSDLLRQKGDNANADKVKSRALEIADEQQLNTYGYQLLAADKKQEAIDVFKINVKRYPNSWNVYDSLADAYNQNGNYKEALSNYKIALSKAPDAQKKRINTEMDKIEKML